MLMLIITDLLQLACQLIYAAILMMLTPKVNYKTALDFYVFNSSVTVFNVVLGNVKKIFDHKSNKN